MPYARVRVAMLLLSLLPLTAQADPLAQMKAGARAHLERGFKLYDQHDYVGAIRELQAGQTIDPRPEFYFALGQAERKLGDCEKAVAYYQVYLDRSLTVKQRDAARAQIEACRASMNAAEPAAQPVQGDPTPTPSTQLAAAPPAPRLAEPPPRVVVTDAPAPAPTRRRLDLVLSGSGLAAAIGGGLLLWHYKDVASTARTYDGYLTARSDSWQQTAAWTAISVGGALAVAGTLDALLRGGAPNLTAAANQTSVSMSWRCAF
jgi:hypothetical protein